jgi:ABC-type multidrug transport system ATPase subunit
MHLRARLIAPTGEARPLDVSAPAIRLGRDPGCEVAVDPVLYPKVSSVHAQIESAAAGFVLVPLSRSNKTLLNNAAVEAAAAIKPGDVVRLGFTGPAIEVLALGADGVAAPKDFGTTVQADAPQMNLLRGTAAADQFAVGGGGILGREKGRVQFLLDHPHVSRRHARLVVKDGHATLADLGSANGTFVNGRQVTRPVPLAVGDRIDVGPFALRFDGKTLTGTSRANNVELAARGVRRVVKERATGQPLTLLDDVSLVVRPGEFVCLLGPSGSGKSTLLAMLSGRAAPNGGAVTVNGRDLYAHFAALKQDIAVVPQTDVLHNTLPVGRALEYTAELRLPPDTGRAGVAATVGDVLGAVGLAHRRGTPIRNLSGGQLKRASLANELLCRPSLLFLDEVTSGLDEQTDREMMELFRLLADGGKTVVCITHTLANVESSCHLVVVLTAGGKLAFVGTPAEAKGYFDVTKLGDVYRRLADKTPEAWHAAFRASPFHATYVRDRLPPDETAGRGSAESAGAARVPVGPVRQAWVLTRRYAAVWRGDPAALLALVGQSLLVAGLMALVFGPLADLTNPVEHAMRTRNLLFLLAVSSFWLGCNTAAKELVKERAIFARERAVNLRADSYYASKLIVLLAIVACQVTLLFGVVRLWCGPPGAAAAQWGTVLLLGAVGTALGLLISAAARTEEVATALVPVAVIPQIVLAGVIAPLSGVAESLARTVITTYWGQVGLERLLSDGEQAILGVSAGSIASAALALGGHAVVCAALTAVSLRYRGPSGG